MVDYMLSETDEYYFVFIIFCTMLRSKSEYIFLFAAKVKDDWYIVQMYIVFVTHKGYFIAYIPI